MAEKPSQDDGTAVMPLGEHLEELRWRVIRCLVALGGAFILCWLFRDRLRVVLVRPHVLAMRAFELDPALKFSSYFEAVVAQVKTCVIAGLILTSPLVIYQAWAFVAPGLFGHERRRAGRLGAACVLCFAAGVAFGYFVFIPTALRYLIGLSGGWAEPVLMIGSYLSTFFLLTFALGMAFQTPVVIFYLVRWGVLDVASLARYRKGVILGAFVVAAVLTPPDPATQVMMAVTLIVLYDVGGLLAAPSRATLLGFVRFTGAVVLVAGALVAWHRYWPVAHLEALRGSVTVGGRPAPGEGQTPLTRGVVCRTGPDGAARIAFGRGGAVVLLAGGSSLQVHGPGALSLTEGACRAETPAAGRELTIRAGPATATVSGARAEVSVLGPGAGRVAVFAGSVPVQAGGAERVIAEGQAATLRAGGEPADLSDAEKRWQQLANPQP